MTRNVKVEFETAVFSMRSALKAALDDPCLLYTSDAADE